MRFLVDTNILTRTAQVGHAQSGAAATAVATLVGREDVACLAAQNLYEFWVVCTRPLGENGLGMSVADAQARLAELLAAFEILDETSAVRPIWQALIVQHDVKGKAAHDTRLVAAMMVHGLSHLLTFNKQHFARYPGLSIMTPDDLIPTAPPS